MEKTYKALARAILAHGAKYWTQQEDLVCFYCDEEWSVGPGWKDITERHTPTCLYARLQAEALQEAIYEAAQHR